MGVWANKVGARLGVFGLLLLGMMGSGYGFEPIVPLPRAVEYDVLKAALGKQLFFDKNLSLDRTVSCASCHDPDHGGAEPRSVSTGVFERQGRINAPSVFNSYFNFRQFWNGRAADLKEQVAGPLHNPDEMGMSARLVEKRLNVDPAYRRAFRRVYGSGVVHFPQVVDAIAEFEKALVTPDSKFDRYLRREIELTADETAGYRLFKRLGCVTCHNGINVGGNSYQYFGAVVPLGSNVPGGDRFELTGDAFDRNRFKVPSLRNVELTAPYLHDGSIDGLSELVETMAYHNLGFRIVEDETEKLLSFLSTLTGKRPRILSVP